MEPPGRPPPPAALLAALLVGATLLAYHEVAGFPFVAWDDSLHLQRNPHLHPLRAEGFARLLSAPYFSEYVPLTYAFYGLEMLASGALGRRFDPRVFHLGSLALHTLCAVAVFALLCRFVRRAAALGGALVFALHPLQVETVAWISETRGLLAGLFALLALLEYARFAEPGAARGRLGARGHYALATLCFALALLSKPSAAAVPWMALCLDVGLLRRRAAAALRALAPWLAMALLFAAVAHAAQRAEIDSATPLLARPLVAADALGFYAAKLLLPIGLGPDYGRTPARVLGGEIAWLGLAIATGLLAAALRARDRRVWLTALCLFAAGLAPVLGLVPFGFQRTSTVADRYVYLPMLGAALALAWGLERSPWRGAAPVAGAALAALGLASAAQARIWRDSETLFRHAVRVNETSFLGHHGLGLLAHGRGDYEAAVRHYEAALSTHGFAEAYNNLGSALAALGRDEQARTRFEQAVAARPEYPTAHANLGGVLSRLGRDEQAARAFETAARLRPGDTDLRLRWAWSERARGDPERALAILDALLRLEPQSPRAWLGMGEILESRGEAEAALRAFRSAARHRPGSRRAHQGIVTALLRLGRGAEALRHAEALAREQPGRALPHRLTAQVHASEGRFAAAIAAARAGRDAEPDSPEAANDLAWLLATAGVDAGAAAEAVALAEPLAQGPGDDDAGLLDTLAAAYAAAGRFEEAARTAERALLRAGGANPHLAEEIAARAALYGAGQPYRLADEK